MRGTTRRKFVRGAALATMSATAFNILRWPADAAEFSYKYGNNVPATYPMNVRVGEAADRIRAATGGRFDLQIFPNGQLGTDSDMLSQVRSGALEFYTTSGLVLSTLVPVSAINGTGFAFRDYGQVWPAMDGDLGAYVRAAIDKSGLHAFEKMFDIGFREITSSTRQINTPEDLAGFKVRIPASQLGVAMFKALGAAPVSMNFSEVYSALQTKVVEGQENPLSIIDTARLYEVQKYCSMTRHMWDAYWFLANGRAFKQLPKDVAEIVSREINKAAELHRQDIAELEASLRQSLEAKGMVFATPEMIPFRQKLQSAGFYEEWRRKFGEEAWALLEKHTGKLA